MRVLRFFVPLVCSAMSLMRKANIVLENKSTQTEEGDDRNVRGYVTKMPSRRSLTGDLSKVHPGGTHPLYQERQGKSLNLLLMKVNLER